MVVKKHCLCATSLSWGEVFPMKCFCNGVTAVREQDTTRPVSLAASSCFQLSVKQIPSKENANDVLFLPRFLGHELGYSKCSAVRRWATLCMTVITSRRGGSCKLETKPVVCQTPTNIKEEEEKETKPSMRECEVNLGMGIL